MSEVTDIEVIAPDGDVILAVGDSWKYDGISMLRVSSHTLSTTSPVFKAMLGPHFQEGKELCGKSDTQAVEIPLPEDDPKAMTLICRLLHCLQAPTEDEDMVERFDILPMALALDKYQVVDFLHWQIRGVLSQWLFELDSNAISVFTFITTVAAAYLLNCDDAYNRATALFINNSDDGMIEMADEPDIINLMPVQVFLILEQRRMETRAQVGKPNFRRHEFFKDEGLCLGCSKMGLQDRYKKKSVRAFTKVRDDSGG